MLAARLFYVQHIMDTSNSNVSASYCTPFARIELCKIMDTSVTVWPNHLALLFVIVVDTSMPKWLINVMYQNDPAFIQL